MKPIKHLIASLAISALVGCGSENDTNSDILYGCFDSSQQTDTSVQWSKLITENATYLSEYKLFDDASDPTKNPQASGLPYDLSVPLFTDYASKYRFIFVPPGCSATYDANEVFKFPIGTVLTKTFSLPSNTDNRGFENEDMIETRLLILRESGWIAMPYVWNEDKSDAKLDINGELVVTNINHDGQVLDLAYGVPDPQKCKRCHQVDGIMEAIGPKARFLNSDYAYDDSTDNQLERWVSEGILSGLPEDISTIDKIPTFKDSTDIPAIPADELQIYAKGWLDINCGHCHRPEGDASNTNMHVEWVRNFDKDKTGHGVCQLPISFGGDGSGDYIIEPGSSERSLMVFRMNTRDGGDRMPPLGRDLIHSEGVELVSAWIDSMPGNICN